jgi:hypothetical protein
MARIFFLAIVIYLIYRLIFELIIPIFTTTRQVKNKFNAMRDQMQDQQNNGYQRKASPGSETQKPNAKAGEYIDFEEIKS